MKQDFDVKKDKSDIWKMKLSFIAVPLCMCASLRSSCIAQCDLQ